MEHNHDCHCGHEHSYEFDGAQNKYALALSKYNTHLHEDEVRIKVDNLQSLVTADIF